MDLSSENIANGWVPISADGEIRAYFRRNGFPERLLITFDALLESNHSRARISGDAIALECEADHVHIGARQASWFQDAQVHDVIAEVSRVREAYKEVLMYGHSMGGYAALLRSGPLAATRVLAFAPQYSIDPKKVPFEDRFVEYAKDIEFVFDNMSQSISRTAQKTVVLDPHCRQDFQHYQLLKGFRNLRALEIPFAGHYPAQMLQEGGKLQTVVVSLLRASESLTELRRAIRAARRRSHRYFVERAVHVARRGNLRDAFELVNRAYVLEPDNMSVIETYQALLHFDSAYYGLAHAMIRLIKHERPDWAHYDSELKLLWGELSTNGRIADLVD